MIQWIDPAELATRATEALNRAGIDSRVSTVKRMLDGVASLTYLGRTKPNIGGSDRVVFKVAPPGLPPVRNRDVLRQARILEVLSGTAGVKVPRVLCTDPGRLPEMPPLFVMNFVEGECYEPLHDEPQERLSPRHLEARALAAARMLAALHRVGADRVPGEPQVSLVEEIGRWARAFATVDPELRPGAEECEAKLLDTAPSSKDAVVLHGDYRLGNMLCRGGDIEAIVDWEIWSLGDPRLDLAWLLLMSDPTHPGAKAQPLGMPTLDALLSKYRAEAHESVGDLQWFAAMVRYKQAATAALIAKHNRKSNQPHPRAEAIGRWPPALLRTALQLLSREKTLGGE